MNIFNSGNNPQKLRGDAAWTPANFQFKTWAESVADPYLGGFGHCQHKSTFKQSEVFAIRIAHHSDTGNLESSSACTFPTLMYLTQRDFALNGNNFDQGWKGISGSPIKIFNDSADLSTANVGLGGLYVKGGGKKCSKNTEPSPFNTAAYKRRILANLRNCPRMTPNEIEAFENFIDVKFPTSEADLVSTSNC